MKIPIMLVMFFVINVNATPRIARQKITLQQAKELVSAAVMPKAKNIRYGVFPPKDFGAVNNKHDFSRFATFSIAFEVGEGIENYSLDIYTGDVFDSSIECFEIKNHKLMALQQRIKKSLHLTQIEYKKIKTKGPMCDE